MRAYVLQDEGLSPNTNATGPLVAQSARIVQQSVVSNSMRMFHITFRDGWTLVAKSEDREALDRWLNTGPMLVPRVGEAARLNVDQIIHVAELDVPADDHTADNYSYWVPPEENQS